jgi:DNA-binding transcriptional LysR family regulator
MLDPHRLRVFRSVLASGSVGAAADNLGMSSSAVSQHLSALQRDTGLVLFRREGRGLVPTPAALTLRDETDELMSTLAHLDGLVTDLREGRTGRLTVGYFPSAGAEWMPLLARRLTQEMPGLTLDFVLNDVPSRSHAPDLDVVVEPPSSPARPGYRRTPLFTDPYVAMVHRDHRLAGTESVLLADLRDDRWISSDAIRDIHTRLVVGACEAAGFRPRYAVQAQDHHTAMAFVAAGVGITVLPALAAHLHPPKAVPLRIAAPTPIRHICALSRDRTAHPAAVERAVELLSVLVGRRAR